MNPILYHWSPKMIGEWVLSPQNVLVYHWSSKITGGWVAAPQNIYNMDDYEWLYQSIEKTYPTTYKRCVLDGLVLSRESDTCVALCEFMDDTSWFTEGTQSNKIVRLYKRQDTFMLGRFWDYYIEREYLDDLTVKLFRKKALG